MKRSKLIIAATLAAISIILAGCERKPAQKEEEGKPAAVSEAKQAPEVMTITGKVLEILDGGNFIFIRLDTEGKKIWATVPSVDVKIGEEVTLRNANIFKKFYSKNLQRSFDELIFSSGVDGKTAKRRPAAASDGQSLRSRRSQRLSGLGPELPPSGKETTGAESPPPAK